MRVAVWILSSMLFAQSAQAAVSQLPPIDAEKADMLRDVMFRSGFNPDAIFLTELGDRNVLTVDLQDTQKCDLAIYQYRTLTPANLDYGVHSFERSFVFSARGSDGVEELYTFPAMNELDEVMHFVWMGVAVLAMRTGLAYAVAESAFWSLELGGAMIAVLEFNPGNAYRFMYNKDLPVYRRRAIAQGIVHLRELVFAVDANDNERAELAAARLYELCQKGLVPKN